ncbi:DUF421 domain-containing protein [Bacillus sp. T33-2]|uniref:DUF421 domain-containing protein n=1 Tax=Bacillus sp. T33-2 TaxID=2054168 RepID=UPI000C7939F9|nr:DUF421 domain-containing protein [Bacillus sp. T33-2]PLR97587.1 hypothetical protein CVD19_08900 [Bacillus sp. T33-2]
MPGIISTIVRSILLIIGLFFITKLLGKKQLSSLSFFEYIVGITVGDIAGTLSMDPDLSLADGLASIVVWSFVPLAISMASLKSKRFRDIVEGKAAIFIKDGRILEKNLRKEKYSIDELLEQLRKKSVFRVSDVQVAYLDSNGELSVLLKRASQPLTVGDVAMDTGEIEEPQSVIMDGKIFEDGLKKAGLNKQWLLDKLSRKGRLPEDVFFAEIDQDGNLFVDLYERQPRPERS